jgi:Na+-transporting methylmalonyl-CoA/oxaloacetate decarboxylase gamma subunit
MMDFGSAVLSALFVVLIVFTVLVLLWVAVRIFSAIILGFEKRGAAKKVAGNGGN